MILNKLDDNLLKDNSCDQIHNCNYIYKYCFWINYFTVVIVLIIFKLIQYWNKFSLVIENLNVYLVNISDAIHDRISEAVKCSVLIIHVLMILTLWMIQSITRIIEIIGDFMAYLDRFTKDHGMIEIGSFSIPVFHHSSNIKDLDSFTNLSVIFPIPRVNLSGEKPICSDIQSSINSIRYSMFAIISVLITLIVIFDIYIWKTHKSSHKEKKSGFIHPDALQCIKLGCGGLFPLFFEFVSLLYLRKYINHICSICQKILFSGELEHYLTLIRLKFVDSMNDCIKISRSIVYEFDNWTQSIWNIFPDMIHGLLFQIPNTNGTSFDEIIKELRDHICDISDYLFNNILNHEKVSFDKYISKIISEDLNWSRGEMWFNICLVVYGILGFVMGVAILFLRRINKC